MSSKKNLSHTMKNSERMTRLSRQIYLTRLTQQIKNSSFWSIKNDKTDRTKLIMLTEIHTDTQLITNVYQEAKKQREYWP